MTGSENSWNIEELVTHMETMQADIDSLESKASELMSQNQQLMSRVQELIVENTGLSQNLSQKETQVQKLSSEISKLQSLLQEMKNELLEKSVLIKKLGNTDLILKQNRNLREYIRKLTQEKLEFQRTVDTRILAVKKDYENALLESKKELRKESRLQYEDQIKSLKGKCFLFAVYSVVITLLLAFMFI